jgi:3-oxocholest-4-en-26-oate---CoA ligase
MDLAHLHDRIADSIPERECIVWRDRRLTWRQVRERTAKFAGFLCSRGLGRFESWRGNVDPCISPHDHLGLLLLNGPTYLEGLIGAHKASMAPFNVNYRYVDDELLYLFENARPAVLLFHSRFSTVLERVLGRMPRQPLLIQVADDSGNALVAGAISYEEILDSPAPLPTHPGASPNDLHILFTGGTTGMPKGVLWRNEDLLYGPLGLSRSDGSPITSEDEAVERAVRSSGRALVTPPLMHGSGTWFALGAMYHGRTVVFPDSVDRLQSDDVVATCQREMISRMMVVGDAFARPIVEELERRNDVLNEMHHVLNSGASLRPELKDRLRAVMPHAKILDTIGASESGPQAASHSQQENSVRLMPGGVVLSDDLTEALAPGRTGLGWLAKTGAIPQGYLDDAVKTAQTFPMIDGTRYVVPGDKVRVLADGSLTFMGRESSTINTGGEKVFAEEIETVLRAVPGVIDTCVVGQPSEQWGEEVLALVQVNDPTTVNAMLLTAECRQHLAGYKVPKRFRFVPRVERLPNGKLDASWVRLSVADQE